MQCFRQGTRNVIRFAHSEYHALAGLNYLINAFYDSIRDDGPVPVPYRDILKVASITDAVFAQLKADYSLVA